MHVYMVFIQTNGCEKACTRWIETSCACMFTYAACKRVCACTRWTRLKIQEKDPRIQIKYMCAHVLHVCMYKIVSFLYGYLYQHRMFEKQLWVWQDREWVWERERIRTAKAFRLHAANHHNSEENNVIVPEEFEKVNVCGKTSKWEWERVRSSFSSVWTDWKGKHLLFITGSIQLDITERHMGQICWYGSCIRLYCVVYLEVVSIRHFLRRRSIFPLFCCIMSQYHPNWARKCCSTAPKTSRSTAVSHKINVS